MSLCGGGNNTTSTTSVQIPKWLEDASKNLITQGQNLSQQPYQPYTGPRVAGFSPQQQEAFGLTQQGIGSYQPYLGQAQGAFNQAMGFNPTAYNPSQYDPSQVPGTSFTPSNYNPGTYTPPQAFESQDFDNAAAQRYMSPYTQNVIDNLTQEMGRQRDIQSKSIGDAAAKSGGFGGYRQGVAESENARNYTALTNQAIAQQYQNAFQNAQNQFNQDQGRRLASAQLNANTGLGAAQLNANTGLGAAGLNANQNLAGAQLANQYGLGSAQLNSANQQAAAQMANQYGLGASQLGLQAGQGLAGLGQLQQQLGQGDVSQLLSTGGLQQALGQQGLDVLYGNYLSQQQWPFQTTGFLSDIIHGAPSGQTSVTSQPGASPLSSILGLGIGGLSLASGMGWLR